MVCQQKPSYVLVFRHQALASLRKGLFRSEPSSSITNGCNTRAARHFLEEIRSEGNGGLGSSHTAPYEAAVPARPPTRYCYPKSTAKKAQWSKGANLQGTRVVVLGSWQLFRALPITCFEPER
jgi:hypothetical protein